MTDDQTITPDSPDGPQDTINRLTLTFTEFRDFLHRVNKENFELKEAEVEAWFKVSQEAATDEAARDEASKILGEDMSEVDLLGDRNIVEWMMGFQLWSRLNPQYSAEGLADRIAQEMVYGKKVDLHE